MSFMNNFESELKKLPDELRIAVAGSLKQWDAQLKELKVSFNATPDLISSMVKVWCSSQFVTENCLRRPELLVDLIDSMDLTAVYPDDTYTKKLALPQLETEEQLMAALRQFRRREMIRIAWRDIAGWAELTETLADLSHLADACIQFALDFLFRQACEKRGTPVLANGHPQQIVVLGMGKLGAYELNYSSDIDLIFAYAEAGVLPDKKSTSYGEFFTRLCQSLVRVLDEITVDGFVFRTDIRLRPYGDSGAVIMTFDGMENYYLTQAREWERYAMIKARQVAGDFDTGRQLMAMLKAFVYRRYLDYGAFEELRSLKQQITQELRRKDRMENIKLGPGGIREIEFIGQAFQLIRGGTEKSLQARGILEVLRILGELGLLTKIDAEQLTQSYCFLRCVENRIQQYQDKQTHDLPTEGFAQQVLAYSLAFPDWDSFKNALDHVRNQVHAVFDQIFSLSKQETMHLSGQKIWLCGADDSELLQCLSQHGFTDQAQILDVIRQFKQSVAIRRLSAKGASVLDRLMPQLIEAMQPVDNPDETFKRILGLFEAVAGRAVYLALLSENPDALSKLVRLSSASSWICSYLSSYPILLDELLDHRSLFEPLKKADLDAQLRQILAAIDIQDIEALMIKLREFKQLNVLRVAAADIMGAIPIMVVSDYLTYIAESIVTHAVKRAWLMLSEKHGCPPDTDVNNCAFAVIGFGKLGGIELGYGSDLDLVFLYDCPDGNAMTDGLKPISSSQFYGRLGLKVRHIMDTRLLSGILYEVDMRLRPSGDSGLLVTPINSYEDYYRTQAWTWEHQALVRARFIAGDDRLKQQFEVIRRRILCLPRDAAQLKTEVVDMREKMRNALATREVDKFDLKQSKGGIADIEFIVQFAVLDQASKNEAFTTYTDNVRLLEGLQAHGYISQADMEVLKAAYCAYRETGHKRVLQGDRALIDEAEVIEMSNRVERIWHDYMD
ncbi:MAG: bifunctional [glutamate--ammonia ligase]-adenylyl-L-tyrosine phosphorylase/[glutamate--ammonia-ligase] adenylyltransferase [Methylococcaceae bacterium]|nr:bifunctional [glutamate--ammonia ligase]-adenylyl-L-tyrosine phosphorylase/[glutamate--ammonia-ligase] adenylyltransferase [Methylococcaceae bacterium]